MITIETDEAEVRLTIPDGDLPASSLQALLDWVRLENVAKKSSLAEKEADSLAEEIKSKWWAENRDRFIRDEDDPNSQ